MAKPKPELTRIKPTGGGTTMFCPHCQDLTECQAFNAALIGQESDQRWIRTDHEDINWFRRARQCLSCLAAFFTAEVDEQFLDELVELRDALGQIKLNAERYLAESGAASKSLTKLSTSLGVLKALKLYESKKA